LHQPLQRQHHQRSPVWTLPWSCAPPFVCLPPHSLSLARGAQHLLLLLVLPLLLSLVPAAHALCVYLLGLARGAQHLLLLLVLPLLLSLVPAAHALCVHLLRS